MYVVDGKAAICVAAFGVAFDGSGTDGQHVAMSYGGVLATAPQWEAFSHEWARGLSDEGIPFFKMAEAMRWYGQFTAKHRDWGSERDARRDALLNRLTDIAVRHQFKATGMWADPRVLSATNPAARKSELFQGAVLTLLQGVPRDAHVNLVCDEEQDIEDKVRAWVRKLRLKHGSSIAPIVSVCFADDRVFPSVQLADMVAWLFRELGERAISTDGNPGVNPLLTKLAHSTQLSIHQARPGELLTGLAQFGEPPEA